MMLMLKWFTSAHCKHFPTHLHKWQWCQNEDSISFLDTVQIHIFIYLYDPLYLNFFQEKATHSGLFQTAYAITRCFFKGFRHLAALRSLAWRRCTTCSSHGGTAQRRWWCHENWSACPALWCCPMRCLTASQGKGCPSGFHGPSPGNKQGLSIWVSWSITWQQTGLVHLGLMVHPLATNRACPSGFHGPSPGNKQGLSIWVSRSITWQQTGLVHLGFTVHHLATNRACPSGSHGPSPSNKQGLSIWVSWSIP